MPEILETVIDIAVFVGITAFLWSVSNSLRLIAQSMHAKTNAAASVNH